MKRPLKLKPVTALETRRGQRSAFTLIELLVVIAILALLVSLLMPSLRQAKQLAKDVRCKTNQRSVALAIVMYTKDYDEYFPYNRDGSPALRWWERVARIVPGSWYRSHHTAADLVVISEGYIDQVTDSFTEGPFKCAAAWEQVEPKGAKSHWNRQFTINRILSPDAHRVGGTDVMVWRTRASDVGMGVVLIGDCSLYSGGGMYPGIAYPRGSGGTYKGKVSPDALKTRGPWPYLDYWYGNPVDFEGHTGGKTHLAFTDAHVEGKEELDPEDFNID